MQVNLNRLALCNYNSLRQGQSKVENFIRFDVVTPEFSHF